MRMELRLGRDRSESPQVRGMTDDRVDRNAEVTRGALFARGIAKGSMVPWTPDQVRAYARWKKYWWVRLWRSLN
jgi:hypothetical protein